MTGWECFFELTNSNVLEKSDIIIAIAHWYIICNSNLRCSGVDENVSDQHLFEINLYRFMRFFNIICNRYNSKQMRNKIQWKNSLLIGLK